MIDIARIRRLIKDFNFDGLFEELGWDRFRRDLPVVVDGIEFCLAGVREKRGFQVFHYLVPSGDEFPSAATMTKVQRAVAKSAHENIVVFSDEPKTRQCYRIAKREEGKLLRSTGLDFHEGHSGEALAQRISRLAISLDEEEDIELVDVAKRASELYAERATRRFFTEFQRQREAFLAFIKGIKDVQQREWYSSLMLNRLMFVYFVQKKGFLDHDLDYLRNRLKLAQESKKEFHDFYRYFLIRLFHDGLNKREADRTDPELESLLGRVPYLNGGIFDQHQIEIENTDIRIPDAAFQGLFDFFDNYTWHLDDRPLRNDQEINPDVLGYIFEKYINQKQMGAYYTKEDITEYISKNTIIPYLFEEAARRNTEPFRPKREVWQLLHDTPDRYIYNAVGHGVFINIHTGVGLDAPVAMPANIQAGVDDVSKRGDWNTAAPAEVALPTETWREHIARRQRCLDLRRKLAAGEITSINDLITNNLDIRQFAQDVIDNCESADLLRAIYYTIAGRMEQVGSNHKAQLPLSVLDPTCGSGAFLFAALNILQPLYDACLTKMEQFVAEADQSQPITIEDEMAALIELGESNSLEFKSTARFDVKKSKDVEHLPKNKQLEILKATDKDRQHDILKAVAAMLNAKGGDLVIGVDDEGNGFGIQHDYMFFSEDGKRNRDGYELWITSLLISNFGKTAAGCVEISFALRDGVDVCRLKISPSPDPVFVTKGGSEVFYRRLNNSSQTLGMEEFAKYRDQRFKGDPPVRVEPKLKLGKTASKSGKKKLTDFREILAETEKHPNRTYFVLKSIIIINNLFGVDIMPEAVEICKLRLFLKLMSTVEPHYAKANLGVEALPDIDFNIRTGNTLVGYTSLDEIKRSYQSRFGLFDSVELKNIEKQVKIVSLNFEMFRRQQTELNGQIKEADKKALRDELTTLTQELDQFLAEDFNIEASKSKKLTEWKDSHKPFHWFAEFFGIIGSGGFAVIIGNPPYVTYPSKSIEYDLSVLNFKSLASKNLYSMVFERSLGLCKTEGPVGLIVQLTVMSSKKQRCTQDLLLERGRTLLLPFPRRPEAMFDGVEMPVAIVLNFGSATSNFLTSRVGRIYTAERPHVLASATTTNSRRLQECRIAKLGRNIEHSILDKLMSSRISLGSLSTKESQHLLYYQEACRYWVKCTIGLPHFVRNGEAMQPKHGRTICFKSSNDASFAMCLLNSSLFYWYYSVLSDCEHINDSLVRAFPIPHDGSDPNWNLMQKELTNAIAKSSVRKLITTSQGHKIEYDEIRVSSAKPVVDVIDGVLGKSFGFSDEEQDFIINYDVKYRVSGTED